MEQLNTTLAAMGLPTSNTGDLNDEVRLYRGMTIGFAAVAGALVLIGGGVVLAGVSQRRRASQLTVRPGGIGWEVRF